jgi:hypothetical protein
MCSWARNSECGRDRGLGDVGIAGAGGQGGGQGRVVAAVVAALQLEGEARLEVKPGAAGHLEAVGFGVAGVIGEGVEVPAGAAEDPVDRHRFAGGRVADEVGAVHLDADVLDPEGDAFEDVGHRIGDDLDLGGDRVDHQFGPHHDVAEVEGTGLGRGDEGEGERGALVGAGEVGLGGGVEGGGADAGADVDLADVAGGRAAGVVELGLGAAGGGGDRGDRGVRALGYAFQRAEQALGQGRLDPGQLLFVV